MDYMEKYNYWMSRNLEDKSISDELKSIEGKNEEIEDRFYRDLSFGTAGLRGVLGAGTNRMNIYTVRKATQGLASYLVKTFKEPSCAIAYDSRINSTLFSEEAAAVLAANGVKVYMYKELMPTPALSYAVRELKCSAGINVTASHNPAKYNGYKVYDNTGCQIASEVADSITANIEATEIFKDVKTMAFEDALEKGLVCYIEDSFVEQFVADVYKFSLNPDLAKTAGFKLIYTPLNGAGKRCVLNMLDKLGVTDVTVVPEQAEPDGNFPTCPYPNPEIKEALELGLKLTEEKGADLLLATDPDCDRVGAAVLTDGKPRLISGNEMGVLMLDYIGRERTRKGTMPKNPVAVRSIVTTNMADRVAKEYGIKIRTCLTGFKYIGDIITELEKEGREDDFLLGFEESYGYLSGTHARDKDAVNGSMLIVEMAAWYKKQGMNLGEAIDALYKKYGYYKNKVASFTFDGVSGMQKMQSILENLRANPFKEIGGEKVTAISDYKFGKKKDINGREEIINLPSSNVLEYELGDKGTVIVRPSGTEPKLKIYYSLNAETMEKADALYEKIKADAEKIIL